MKRDWKKWFAAAGIRAVRTFAQTFVAMIGVGAALVDVDWAYVASCAAVSAILSLATSLAGLPELEEEKDYTELNIEDENNGRD